MQRPSTSGNYINRSSFIHNSKLNDSVLLPEFVQQNGYYVCGAGKLFHGYHFNNEVKGRGFDEYFPSKEQDLPPWRFNSSKPQPRSGVKLARYADLGPYHPEPTLRQM